MRFDNLKFFRRQLPGLVYDFFVNRDFADIVKRGSVRYHIDIAHCQIIFRRFKRKPCKNHSREMTYTHDVPAVVAEFRNMTDYSRQDFCILFFLYGLLRHALYQSALF